MGWIILLIVLGVIVLIGLVVLATQLPDIMRYRRIRSM
jgi:Family of unknown function (DUF6893)